jgi:hypothetical protein
MKKQIKVGFAAGNIKIFYMQAVGVIGAQENLDLLAEGRYLHGLPFFYPNCVIRTIFIFSFVYFLDICVIL